MARMVLVKDLANINQGIVSVVLSSIIGDTNIGKHDPTKTYNAGDRAYKIIDGKIVIKKCTAYGVKGDDFNNNWEIAESLINGIGSSATQDKNSYQSVSAFEKKMSDDISTLTNVLGSLTDLSNEGIRGTFMFPLFTKDEITLNGGIYDFGRVII